MLRWCPAIGKGVLFGLATAGVTGTFLIDIRDWRAVGQPACSIGLAQGEYRRCFGFSYRRTLVSRRTSARGWPSTRDFRGRCHLRRLHLVRADKPVSDPSAWYAGYEALTGMFGRFADPKYIDGVIAVRRWPGLGLVAVGDGVRSLGCHVGWVFQIQLFRRVSTADQTGDYGWIVSAYDQTIGIAFLVILSASWLLFRRRLRAT